MSRKMLHVCHAECYMFISVSVRKYDAMYGLFLSVLVIPCLLHALHQVLFYGEEADDTREFDVAEKREKEGKKSK